MPIIPLIDHSPDNEPSQDHETSPERNLPLTLLKIHDLSSQGAKRFLHSTDPSAILADSIRTVLRVLTPDDISNPNVRSITLILRAFDGVAYTAGKDIDFEHKEIHFSTTYIASLAPERVRDEIAGVLVHEMVHVWQWNGQHQCNGGLIEGIADWVRLQAGLAPPHWRRRCEECEWDDGYEVTGYFLDWIDERVGKGIVVKINQKLRQKYVEEEFWAEFCNGEDVQTLWAKYAESLGEQGPDKDRQRETEAGEGEENEKQ
ncbi:hypothetical protein ACLMJK_005815 [Lecanora helva]